MISPDFSELDALLSESLAQVQEARSIAKIRLTLPRLESSGDVVLITETRSKILLWESKHVWKTEARTAVFFRDQCACGGVADHFSHWMLHQSHREVPTRIRYTRATPAVLAETAICRQDIPTTCGVQVHLVEVCPDCAGEWGLDLGTPAFSVKE